MRNEEQKRKVMICCLYYYLQMPRSRDNPNRPHQVRKQWSSYRERLTDHEFQKRFRMSKHAFDTLVNTVHPYLVSDSIGSGRRHAMYENYWMPPVVKVAVTLRWLAGGAMYDIADHFGYSVPTVYCAKERTIKAILRCGQSGQIGPVEFKEDDETWLAEKAELFQGARISNPLGRKCVGALDGLAIEIERPTKDFQPKQYSNRKGFYAICCQAICDAQNRFLLFDCRSPGSTHDSVAFSRTSLFPKIQQGLPDDYWIAADAAYPLVGSLVKPFRGKVRTDQWEDSFNYHLSSLRVTIENSFGIFIQRWGIFWRSLQCDPDTATRIILACVFLHNFIIDIDGSEKSAELLERGKQHIYLTLYQDQLSTSNYSSLARNRTLRQNLVGELERLMIRRPPISFQR